MKTSSSVNHNLSRSFGRVTVAVALLSATSTFAALLETWESTGQANGAAFNGTADLIANGVQNFNLLRKEIAL